MSGLIYQPKGRAREYAALACNVYRGCDHGCTYCYAPAATCQSGVAFVQSRTRGVNFLANLEREAAIVAATGTQEKVLLSFTCDPYQALDVQERVTRQAIAILHAARLSVQVLTKGGSRALRDLDLFTDRDAFATTLTFLDDGRSRHWEPGAALPGDRLIAIQKFHAAGIPTWVSLEPVVGPEETLAIIERTHAYVDLYKVGTLNYHPLAKTIDWAGFGQRAITLLTKLGKHYYIKQDLRRYLANTAA